MNNHIKSKIWFVSRHQGSIAWIKNQDVAIDNFIDHLDETHDVQQGDTVIGSLPVQTIAKLNKQGVKFIHLQLDLPLSLRGIDLTAEQINKIKPTLKEYLVWECDLFTKKVTYSAQNNL